MTASTESAGPPRDARSTPAHETLTDYAVDEIRKRIVIGEIAAGSKIGVDFIAKELAVSRIPVREAFRELLAEGLVEMYPHRGAVVAGIARRDVEDGYRLLEVLEVMAVERAAATAPAETASRMRVHLQRLAALREAGQLSPLALLEEHRSFHFAVFDALETGMLERTARSLWHACERFINASARGDRLEQAHHEHLELVRYLEAGDVIGAVAVTQMHVRHGRHAALRGLGFDPS
ncbi:GntR family transcriptional regulator [Pseudonocardia sp. MH-G8]|uniref:GntR family transcriptional regulator n=1 Tax=Pseudonocardia sp. MH-G8 TaxID=1854588 RepID=UPI000B9FB0BA|nr:GntR family transcriptional regulator [Pseudonocardia sp. MH-G8]OZM79775.1 GntR family transcriptional regulator [Pseudonocardia sp. MH-G8]